MNRAEFHEVAPQLAEFLADVGIVMTLKADGSIFFRATDLDPDGKLRAPGATKAVPQPDAATPAQPTAAQLRERNACVVKINELAAQHDPEAVRQAIREHLQAKSSVYKR
jgi:hypothetical protein